MINKLPDLDWSEIYEDNDPSPTNVEKLVKLCHEFAFEGKHSHNNVRAKFRMALRDLEYDKGIVPDSYENRQLASRERGVHQLGRNIRSGLESSGNRSD